jgi:hypothetical protein
MKFRTGLASAGVAAVLMSVAACSGSSSVSQSKLDSKLKSEPEIQQLLQQGGAKATVTSQVVSCIATALEKNASQADLKDYVSGKKNLDDIGGATKGSANAASAEVKSCATNVATSAAASVSASGTAG